MFKKDRARQHNRTISTCKNLRHQNKLVHLMGLLAEIPQVLSRTERKCIVV